MPSSGSRAARWAWPARRRSRSRVWLDDWTARGRRGAGACRCASAPRTTSRSTSRSTPGKPLVLQGDRGLHARRARAGQRVLLLLATRGCRARHGRASARRCTPSQRLGWMDREWSTSALGEAPGRLGLVRAAARRRPRADVLPAARRRTDRSDPASRRRAGRDSTARRPRSHSTTSVSTSRGTGPAHGAARATRSEFRLTIPTQALALDVLPVIADQELDLSFRYWEGAVDVRGTHTGRGYLEMTGRILGYPAVRASVPPPRRAPRGGRPRRRRERAAGRRRRRRPAPRAGRRGSSRSGRWPARRSTGPATPANFSRIANRPKNSPELLARDQAGEERARERLARRPGPCRPGRPAA